MRILVATDGSECSSYMIDYIISRPWAEDDTFKVVMVALAKAGMMISGVPVGTVDLPEEREEADRIVVRDSQILKNALSNTVEYEVLDGFAADSICDCATKENMDLILLGSHGRTGIERFVLGSVAEAVLKKSPCSVEVIKLPKALQKDEDDDS